MADYNDEYLGGEVRGGGDANTFPSNQYGGFQHTLFLGCSVMEFSATVGWNQQVSELTVQLVEDDQAAPATSSGKRYYTSKLVGRTTYDADPGFNSYGGGPPQVGSPVYFRVGDFEFAGLLQSWTETSDQSANPSYTVKIVDPRQILENAQLIIGDYAGGVPTNLYNVFNVYGVMERFAGGACPAATYNGANFGSIAGGFGGSDSNQNGMPVSRILRGTQLLTSTWPRELAGMFVDQFGRPFSPYGRLVYKGPEAGEHGYGVMPADYNGLSFYLLDLAEVPIPADYYRKRDTSMSIMQLLNEISDDFGLDYYVELIILTRGVPSVTKFIKIRTVSRSRQPNFGEIDDFVGECSSHKTLLATNRNKGRELRNEETASMVIGGNEENIFQATRNIYPFFGMNPPAGVGAYVLSKAIYPQQDADDIWYFDVNIVGLTQQLNYLSPSQTTITITEQELLAALGGFQSWDLYIRSIATDTRDVIVGQQLAEDLGLTEAVKQGKFDKTKVAKPDVKKIRGSDELVPTASEFAEDMQKVFDFVHSIATNFYGKKWLVDIPFSCYFIDSEAATFTGEAKIQYTDIPSDGGWAWTSTVLGLPHPTSTVTFTLDDNRLGAFMRFQLTSSEYDRVDFSALAQDEYVYYAATNTLYVKAQVQDRLVYFDESVDASQTPKVVLELPQCVKVRNQTISVEQTRTAGTFDMVMKTEPSIQDSNGDIKDSSQKKVGGNDLRLYPIQLIPKYPNGAAVPLKSTVRTYGPWSSSALSLPAGTVRVVRDEGLVPWEYGNGLVMHTAGQYLANSNITRMQVGEMGEVTVLGYPNIPLGAEIGARGLIRSYFSNIDRRSSFQRGQHNETDVVGSTNQTTYASNSFNIRAGTSFGQGIYGPNITNINVKVGPQGIQTTYTLRTYTTIFGRLEKYNANRLKHLNSNIVRQQKKIFSLVEQMRNAANRRFENQYDMRRRAMDDMLNKANPSNEVLVGQTPGHPRDDVGAADKKRSLVMVTDTSTATHELTYPDGKAVASWDALVRPISIRGDGSLPRYATFTPVENVKGHDPGAQPPVKIEGVDSYDLEIDGDYSNPYGNPAEGYESRTPTLHEGGDGSAGHDIGIVMRSNLSSSGTLSMVAEGAAADKDGDWQSDYRTFALRGPLVLQGWGYDTDGKPIPNTSDTADNAANGIFENEGMTNEFLHDFMQRSDTWPVGPVDLRWDRKRSMWVAPPSYRLLVGKLTESVSPDGSGDAEMINGNDLYDSEGNPVTPEEDGDITFIAHDKLGTSHNNGEKFYAYFNPDVNEYWMLGGGGGGLAISDSGCQNEGSNLFINDWSGGFLDIDRLIASTGLQIGSTGSTEGSGGYTWAKLSLQTEWSYRPTGTAPGTQEFADPDGPKSYDHIHFDIEGIEIERDTDNKCQMTINCRGLQTDEAICVVTDVYCEDNQVKGTKIGLTFNECGWLLSTGDCPE